MSNEPLPEPRYILAVVQRGAAHVVAEADDLDEFLPHINCGGAWTVWERGIVDAPVRVAYFEFDAPMKLLGAGNARCLEDRWHRGKRGSFQTVPVAGQPFTRADLDDMLTSGRHALAERANN